MALKQAVCENLIANNVATAVKLPRIENKEVVPLSNDEISKFILVAKEHWLYPAIVLELGTGLRRGALLALTWENVDFENETIKISRSYIKTKVGNVMQDETKTKASRRIIPVPHEVMLILQKHKVVAFKGSEFVFTQQSSEKPISPRHFSKMYETLCIKAGLRTTKFHDLRNTYASQQLALNTHMKTISQLLGNSDIKTTMNTYSHVTDKLEREAATKLNGVLKTYM